MKYKPLPKDSDIDPEVALLQAAAALDVAGETAERMSDVEGLLNTAAMWMKFGEHIQTFAENAEEAKKKADHAAGEGEMVKSSASKIEVGFQCEKPEETTVGDGEEID